MTHQVVIDIAKPRFLWLDVVGPTREELREIAGRYALFPTLVEDSLEPEHLPKFEQVEDVTFLIVRAFDEEAAPSAATMQALTRKTAIFCGPEFLITVHRVDQPFLARLRTKWRAAAERRGPGPERRASLGSRLMVDLINGAVDTFERPLETVEDRLDDFESALFGEPDVGRVLREVYVLKRRVTLIKRMLWHTLNAVVKLKPRSSASAPLFQDARENVESMHFFADELLDDVNNLLHVHLGLASHRTNQIVRVLTVFSVFFMPLTFIVGVYGMNFSFMPELTHRLGYPAVWAVMIGVTIAIYFWFRHRGWLSE
jgi:magnesium transporter